MKIGIGSRNYGYRRVCYGLPVAGAEFRKLAYVPWKLVRRGSQVLQNTYLFADLRRCDLVHLWNGICVSNRPWISSFEAHFPRYGLPREHWIHRWAVERLHHSSCKRMLALSDAAKSFFLRQNNGLLDDEVIRKTEVFYGGVEIDPELRAEHERFVDGARDELVLSFVGHDFFRKGGWGILDAMDEMRGNYGDVRLKIVSGLTANDYASREEEPQTRKAKERIEKNANMEWYESLEHRDVMKLLAHSHVSLLPTLDDTLGWSLIEAMSVGVPVIATNVFAVPEIVDDGRNGFLIPLPLGENRRWKGIGMRGNKDEFIATREAAYKQISSKLVEYIAHFREKPELCRSMGRAAIEKVKERFNPEKQARRLGEVYCEVV